MTSPITRFKARFYESADWDTVTCHLCPHLCSIAPSRQGACGVRSNRGGVLYCDNYAKIASAGVVPAVDLPLYHFKPGMKWLLLGLKGCNMRCPFCNTARFSQLGGVRTQPLRPDEAPELARGYGAEGIAFGISEPAVAHEFVADVFAEARQAGLATFLQTSGAWNEDAFREILAVTDAVTFGFKGFDEQFLNNECGGHLEFIRQNVEAAIAVGTHVEASFLAIEDLPAMLDQARAFAEWLASRNARVPVVVLRLRKAFSWRGSSTSNEALMEVREAIREHLEFVYLNEPDAGYMTTHCPSCDRVLVRRGLAGTIVTPDQGGCCPQCGTPVPYRP
ncbi:radical SAM protein [Candidatus Poribacteria bacterium]|nr:radical SAM protein [Candidatus Poribacteria bacterium]